MAKIKNIAGIYNDSTQLFTFTTDVSRGRLLVSINYAENHHAWAFKATTYPDGVVFVHGV